MKIETKFDIGDKVKFFELIEENNIEPIAGHGRVARIHICSSTQIFYSIYNEVADHAYFVSEHILERH